MHFEVELIMLSGTCYRADWLLHVSFRLIEKLDFPDSKFSLYFLGYHSAGAVPEDPKERVSLLTYTHAC